MLKKETDKLPSVCNTSGNQIPHPLNLIVKKKEWTTVGSSFSTLILLILSLPCIWSGYTTMCCLTEVANYPNRFIISWAWTKENYNQTIAIVRTILSNLVNNDIKYTEIKSFNF